MPTLLFISAIIWLNSNSIPSIRRSYLAPFPDFHCNGYHLCP
ncbi:hypothetical protein GT23_4083 [Parageobacillus thermoglucosidasius]|nr:hypothetical protein GT23_4083 [Parageobacillus thermoglucosidasius]